MILRPWSVRAASTGRGRGAAPARSQKCENGSQGGPVQQEQTKLTQNITTEVYNEGECTVGPNLKVWACFLYC